MWPRCAGPFAYGRAAVTRVRVGGDSIIAATVADGNVAPGAEGAPIVPWSDNPVLPRTIVKRRIPRLGPRNSTKVAQVSPWSRSCLAFRHGPRGPAHSFH